MSLTPCIAKLSSSFWPARRHVRFPVFLDRRVEQRLLRTHLLPLELRETINPEVVKRLKDHHEELRTALEKKNVDDLFFSLTSSRREFFALPKLAWRHIRENHLHLMTEELEEIAHVLAERGKKDSATALGQLVRDAKAMYGVDPSADMFLSALKALVHTRQQLEAYDLLRLFLSYKVKPFRLNSQHWQITMRGLSQIGEVDKLKECLVVMKGSLPFPDSTHYFALLYGLYRRAEPPSIDEVLQVLDEIQRLNLPYDVAIHGLLIKIGQKLGHDLLPSEYKERCAERRKPSDTQVEEWLNQLVAYKKRARVAFETKLIDFRNDGFVPDERTTLIRLVQISALATPDVLIYLQETLGLPPNSIAWSICIRNILQKTGWRNALAAYNTAKAQGIKPNAPMIHPLLRAMCSKFVHGPPEQVLDIALELYKDCNESMKSGGRHGADTPVFNTLLRALAASKNKQKHFPIAFKMLQDMRDQGVYMDRMTATSVAVLLVRSSSTYEEAVEAYKQVRSVIAEGLDQKGFTVVLHAFCSLEPANMALETNSETSTNNPSESDRRGMEQSLPIPPAKLYFDILRDMCEHGFRKTAEVYTILLGHYASLATRARDVRDPERRDSIVSTLRNVIKETHRQISIEAGLIPDSALLNQLMDAYNRAGLFRDVMQVWTMLNSAGLVTPTSVSIIFDACGFQKQTEQADAIFRDLKERGFKLNRRNWNSWVECLCRSNRLDEALELVCFKMKNAMDPEERPDANTVQILRSFGLAHGRLEEVQSYLKKHLPSL
ncbi:hypothetical protein ACEPAG_154 [Sanghuangporus baumii]